eukprot:1161749-Pelagomonas_calceolata.AAC.6
MPQSPYFYNKKAVPYCQHSSWLTWSTPQKSPPPARSRWPPLHSGHTLGSTCRLGGAAGGLEHTRGEFGWLSAQICRHSAQQASPNGTSTALKSCFFLISFQVVRSESAEVGLLEKGRIAHRA